VASRISPAVNLELTSTYLDAPFRKEQECTELGRDGRPGMTPWLRGASVSDRLLAMLSVKPHGEQDTVVGPAVTAFKLQ
jgi:hypothetical protein